MTSSPRVLSWLALILLRPGCLSYSSYQSAKVVARGEQQAVIAITHSEMREENEDEAFLWNQVEFMARRGIARNADLGVRLTVGMPQEGDGMLTYVAVDPKIAVVPDYLALSAPLGVFVGDFSFLSMQTHPGLIASVPLGSRLEFNAACKSIVFFRGTDLNGMWALNLGLGLPVGSIKLRPEIGWLFGDVSDETMFMVGIGIEPPPR